MSQSFCMTSNVVKLDSRIYGDDGYLPGVEIDRQKWINHFNKLGITPVANFKDTTKRQFAEGLRNLSEKATSGDLVCIQHSGHGTQRRDQSGDESDGKDEVICLHDGTLLDDDLWNLLLLFKKGVQVLLIMDTCHAGTSFRSFDVERVLRKIIEQREDLNCSLLSIGTSSDHQTAADTQNGGAGSSSLLATYDLAQDYRDWVLRGQKWLRSNRFRQDMVLNEINAEHFGTQKPFKINSAGNPDAIKSNISSVTIRYDDGTQQVIRS